MKIILTILTGVLAVCTLTAGTVINKKDLQTAKDIDFRVDNLDYYTNGNCEIKFTVKLNEAVKNLLEVNLKLTGKTVDSKKYFIYIKGEKLSKITPGSAGGSQTITKEFNLTRIYDYKLKKPVKIKESEVPKKIHLSVTILARNPITFQKLKTVPHGYILLQKDQDGKIKSVAYKKLNK